MSKVVYRHSRFGDKGASLDRKSKNAVKRRSYRRSPLIEKVSKKIVFVGESASGKTCMIDVYVNQHFPNKYQPTILETYNTQIQVGGLKLDLDIFDTSGDQHYDEIRPISYYDTDIFVLCFAIDSPNSLINVQRKWYPEVKAQCPEVPILLVGTKSDLRRDERTIKELARKAQVPVKEHHGKAMADTIGAKAYAECSSKLNLGVKEIFEVAMRATMKSGHGSSCSLL